MACIVLSFERNMEMCASRRDPFLYDIDNQTSKDNDNYEAGTGFVPPWGKLSKTVSRTGTVLHTQLYPSFLHKVHEDRGTIRADRHSVNSIWERLREPCNQDAMKTGEGAIWQKTFVANDRGRSVPLLIVVEPFTAGPFPQQHIIRLVDRTDPFTRWSFSCTPFSFKTLAKRSGWNIDDEGEDMFVRFGCILKERIKANQAEPKRFPIVLRILRREKISMLTFVEILHGYRKVELLQLEFKATKWKHIKLVVQEDFQTLKAHQDLVTLSLVQTIELIGRHQPSLILDSVVGEDHEEEVPTREWDHHMLQAMTGSSENEHRTDTNLPAAGPDDTADVVRSVLLPLKVHSATTPWPEENTIEWTIPDAPVKSNSVIEHYILTIYRKPLSCYAFTLSHPTKPFEHYTSEDITKDRFEVMTNEIAIAGLESNKMHGKTAKESILGFHATEGVGGLLTVVFDDLASGCINKPEAYRAQFNICKSATLRFEHRSLPDHRWKSIFCIRFSKTGRDLVADEIRDKFRKVQQDIDNKLRRIYSLLEHVRTANPALLTTLAYVIGKLHTPLEKSIADTLDIREIRNTAPLRPLTFQKRPALCQERGQDTKLLHQERDRTRETPKRHNTIQYKNRSKSHAESRKSAAFVTSTSCNSSVPSQTTKNETRAFRETIKSIAEKARKPGYLKGCCNWFGPGPNPTPTPAALVPELIHITGWRPMRDEDHAW